MSSQSIDRVEAPMEDTRREEPAPPTLDELFEENPERAADIAIDVISDGEAWETVQALKLARANGCRHASRLLDLMERKAEQVLA